MVPAATSAKSGSTPASSIAPIKISTAIAIRNARTGLGTLATAIDHMAQVGRLRTRLTLAVPDRGYLAPRRSATRPAPRHTDCSTNCWPLSMRAGHSDRHDERWRSGTGPPSGNGHTRSSATTAAGFLRGPRLSGFGSTSSARYQKPPCQPLEQTREHEISGEIRQGTGRLRDTGRRSECCAGSLGRF
jgi:hypothetical protein